MKAVSAVRVWDANPSALVVTVELLFQQNYHTLWPGMQSAPTEHTSEA